MAIGAYATAMFTQNMATPLCFTLSMHLGMELSELSALMFGIPTLRCRGVYLAMSTMGAAVIIRVIINNQ